MAAMFSNNEQSVSHCNPKPNQPLSSSLFHFMDEPETLILQQQKKKPRLASWGRRSSDGSLNQVAEDIRYNFNPIPPFFEKHQTLISPQITKKPRLTSWGCGDGSNFNKFSDICYNPIPNQSLASSISPFFHEHQTLISQQNTRLEAPWWSVDKSLDQLSVIFNKPPPITSNSTAGVSKPPPEVIIIDDDEEEEIVPISNDNNQKLDSNGKESSSIHDNEEDSRSVVVIDSEKKKNNNGGGGGGFGHVSVDDLGVTIEDLKRIPWEAFDPSLGIKSVMLDPSFGWICSTNY